MQCTSTVTNSAVLRSNDSADKINSDLGTVALAHTGCTQALWRESGVRDGGCEVAYNYMCHRSATAASKSLQGRSKRSRLSQDMSWLVPETGDFVQCPGYALFVSLMRKKIDCYDLNCHSIGFKVGLTFMLRNCVSFFLLCTHSRMLYLSIDSPQTAPIPYISRLAQPCAILASSVQAPVYFRESAWSLCHGLLAVFTLVCSSHLHGY